MSIDIHGVRVDTPEHDKLEKINGDDYVIGQFLEWLLYEGDYQVMQRRNREWVPTSKSVQGIIAEYFEIDIDALNAEKKAILNALSQQTKREA